MPDLQQLRLFIEENVCEAQPVQRKRRSTVSDDYWDEPSIESRIKMALYTDYFMGWQSIMRNALRAKGRDNDPLIYIDLYAGQGRYKNGEDATAVRVARKICADPNLSQRVMIVMNERHRPTHQALTSSLASVAGVSHLAYAPCLDRMDAAKALDAYLPTYRDMTKLIIIDPWGYNLYTPDLWPAVIDGWGTDCLFFLNNLRIRLLLYNRSRSTTTDRLFGKRRADRLREACKNDLDPLSVDGQIIRAMDDILTERGLHATRFIFTEDNGRMISHSIWTVSKSPKAIQLMRRVAEKNTVYPRGGEPILGYNPSPWELHASPISMFGQVREPWQQRLAYDLQVRYGGLPSMRIEEVILRHHRFTNYTNKAYKEVMMAMERDGTLVACPPASQRRGAKSGHLTLGDNVEVLFFCPEGL